jgi:hypothetical protein
MTTITKTKVVLSAAIVLGAVSAASASALPSIDIQKACRAVAEGSLGGTVEAFDTCISDEREARQKLAEGWTNFPARDKAHCVLPADYLPNYTEWLICLEMERDFRKIRQQHADEQAGGTSPGRNRPGTSSLAGFRESDGAPSSGSRPLKRSKAP